MQRFFIAPEAIQGDDVQFTGRSARQISRVLRLKPGAQLVVLDDQGNELLVELEQVSPAACNAKIINRSKAEEPRVRLLMLLSLTQREKFEWMLQKCTEVGAAAFQPVITRRALIQNKAEVSLKYERWRTILKEAAEQSGRGLIPKLLPPATLAEAVLTAGRSNPIALIPWEAEKDRGIKEVLSGRKESNVTVLIGPEGGFSVDEVQAAVGAGFVKVTLGKRILRMETAAVVAAALVFHELESTTPCDG